MLRGCILAFPHIRADRAYLHLFAKISVLSSASLRATIKTSDASRSVGRRRSPSNDDHFISEMCEGLSETACIFCANSRNSLGDSPAPFQNHE
jgi:hypothetical protein